MKRECLGRFNFATLELKKQWNSRNLKILLEIDLILFYSFSSLLK
jgi:hypothetical protein